MSSKSYEELLEKALSQLPQEISRQARFELPEPTSSVMGNRTILYNIKEIADVLRRPREHILKFLAKELATAGSILSNQAVFQGKFDNGTIKRLINRYAQEYIFCPICNQPDTRIEKEGRYNFLICEACGAKSSAKRNL
jgi:translation initiation factor 2 subunit 2